MRDQDCIVFLQHYLPRLGLRWPGYRKVRRTVCKRLARRLRTLEVASLTDYGDLLKVDPAERARFDRLCWIPISRFYRDKRVFEALGETLLPSLAQGAVARGCPEVWAWCAGCASGEEPYSLRLVWDSNAQHLFPMTRLAIVASDADTHLLERAEAACYAAGSLKDLPDPLKETAFVRQDSEFCLRSELKAGITFIRQDIRTSAPPGLFDLILCRNLVFTYFELEMQRAVLTCLDKHLRAGGLLVIGAHERLPYEMRNFERKDPLPIYRKI